MMRHDETEILERWKEENQGYLERLKKTGKKIKGVGVLRMLFGRTTIVVALILLQAYVLYLMLVAAIDVSQYIHMGLTVLSFCIFVSIVNSDMNSSFKIAWVTPILVFPVFGGLFYLYCELDLGKRRLRKKTLKIEDIISSHLIIDENQQKKFREEAPDESGMLEYFRCSGNAPAFPCEYAQFFPSGEEKIPRLIEMLKKARRFIFLEYFIIFEGSVWDDVLEILKQKAAEGVEVRVLYDGMSSLTRLPIGYFKKLEKAGIHARAFAPIRPILSTYQNNRDHRKIVVVDGKVAFSGGINLADEYANRIVRFGYWKDTGVMVAGESVTAFTYMFLKMWTIAGKESELSEEEMKRYAYCHENGLTESERESLSKLQCAKKGGFVVPFGDNPYDDYLVGRTVYMDILNRAQHYVHIMTPYLILDDEMVTALIYAAQRGVEVSIIMPHIPDKRLIYAVARTYYKNLIRHGVKIYEFVPGFVHAKEFISDGVRATCGTINLDYRSFYLHFEDAVYFSRTGIVDDMEADYQKTLEACEEITLTRAEQFPKLFLLGGMFLRIIAPLL